MSIRVLIVDDEGDFIERVSFGLKGFDIIAAASEEEARQRIDESIDVIMLDLNLSPADDKMEGLDLIDYFKSEFPHIPITIITGYDDVDIAVGAMKRGADDFLKKRDMDILEWRKRIELLARTKSLKVQVTDYEREKYQFIGESNAAKDIKNILKTLGQHPDITILIRGETGVGKEVAAKFLHSNSPRFNKPFVAVNISANQSSLLESALFGHKKGAFTGATEDRIGYFRKADGGILFLDEIGDLTMEAQGKILRFLEDKIINVVGDEKDIKLDVQIVAATNKDLEDMIKKGIFRKDLYYRIKNFTVDILPLRERREDIRPLVNHFLRLSGYDLELDIIDEEVRSVLVGYGWPGNIRELENTIERSMVLTRGHKVGLDDLIYHGIGSCSSMSIPVGEKNKTLKTVEKEHIESVLKSQHGNISKTARILGIDRKTLYSKIEKYKIK